MKTAVASPAMPSPPAPPARKRRAVVLGLAAVMLAVVAIAWHVTAITAYRATEAQAPTSSRLSSARLAATLEPWDVRFKWRVVTLEAQQLFESGQVDAAFFLLLPYSQVVRGDEVYRSVYQQVVAAKTPLDARKAHQQHAREQAGGALRPEDVFR